MAHTIDIILPCFNPIKGWEKTVLEKFQSLLNITKEKYSLRLIIVNDGSIFNIQKEIDFLKDNLEELFTYLEYKENKGKGFALRYGVKQSVSDFIIYTDIDFPYSEKSIVKVIDSLANNKEVILTKRNNTYYKNSGFIRKYVSKILKVGIKILIGLDFKDTQAGLKGFNKKGKNLFLNTKINRYLFDLEFARNAIKNNYDYDIIEIDLRDNIVLSKLNLKILLSEGFDFLRLSFKK